MKKSAVITGANRGIGLSLTRQYQQQGWQVYAVCRQSSEELEATGAKVFEGIDVADSTAIRQLAEKLNGIEINLLINMPTFLNNEVLGQID